MKKKVLKLILDVLIILNMSAFLLFVIYYFHGSLESLPTGEQQDAVRTVCIVIMIGTGIFGVLCGLIRNLLFKKK